MDLKTKDLEELLEVAKRSALEAGRIINNASKNQIEVNHKDDAKSVRSQIVTNIDLEVEKQIYEHLYSTFEKYDLGILTEETTDNLSRLQKDFFWAVDPIDGTYYFAKDVEGYAVSIGLLSAKGEPILGVVYDPRNDDLYSAIKGLGAFKNHSPFRVRKIQSPPIEINDNDAGAVLNCLKTIENSPAFYCKRPKKELGGGCIWDYAACAIIQLEAGGYYSDFYGQPLNLNSSETVYMNQTGVFFSSSKEILPPT